MAALNKPFFDTSILVAALIDFGESSAGAIEIFDRLAAGEFPQACTAWHCCLEFYSVVTRLPEEYRLDPHTARTLVEREIVERLTVGSLAEKSRSLFFAEAERTDIRGGRIYDAHIGAVAIGLNASVMVTENKKYFANLPERGIPVLSAKEFLQRVV